MKVDDRPVDARVIKAWKQSLARHEAAELRNYASQHPRLSAGFRKGKISAEVAATRIQALLDAAGELPPDLGLLLRDATLSRRVLAVFSQEALTGALALLAATFGRANVFGALLLDLREPVRQLGFDQIADWDGAEPDDEQRKLSGTELLLHFKPFFAELLPALGATLPTGGAEAGVKAAPARHDGKSAALVLKLRESRQEGNRMRRQLDQATSERGQAQARAQEFGNALEKAKAELAASTSAHDGLKGQFEQRVQQALQRRLDDRLLPWLRPAEALSEAATQASADLLQRANDLLQRQSAADRKFGLRRQLQDEIGRCRATLARLKEAMEESIRPLPELAAMADNVAARITELEATLGRSSTAPGRHGQLPEPLAHKLSQARTLEDVAAVRSALLSIETLGLLQGTEISAACALIADKASRLYHQAKLDRDAKGPRAAISGLPLFALQERLANGLACTLLVDGHNMLFQLPQLFASRFERGEPGALARQALVERLLALCERCPQLTVELWFDSVNAQDETLRDNLRVHYSGGTGANRADDQIVAYLQHLHQAAPERLRALATADRDEADRALRLGTLVLAPQELALLMSPRPDAATSSGIRS